MRWGRAAGPANDIEQEAGRAPPHGSRVVGVIELAQSRDMRAPSLPRALL